VVSQPPPQGHDHLLVGHSGKVPSLNAPSLSLNINMQLFFTTQKLMFHPTYSSLTKHHSPLETHNNSNFLYYDQEMSGQFLYELGEDSDLCTGELRDRLNGVYNLAENHEIYEMIVLPCAVLISSGPMQFRCLTKQIILTRDLDPRRLYESLYDVYRVSKELYGTLQEHLTSNVVFRFWRRVKSIKGRPFVDKIGQQLDLQQKNRVYDSYLGMSGSESMLPSMFDFTYDRCGEDYIYRGRYYRVLTRDEEKQLNKPYVEFDNKTLVLLGEEYVEHASVGYVPARTIPDEEK
jgi:hypothetical protein